MHLIGDVKTNTKWCALSNSIPIVGKPGVEHTRLRTAGEHGANRVLVPLRTIPP